MPWETSIVQQSHMFRAVTDADHYTSRNLLGEAICRFEAAIPWCVRESEAKGKPNSDAETEIASIADEILLSRVAKLSGEIGLREHWQKRSKRKSLHKRNNFPNLELDLCNRAFAIGVSLVPGHVPSNLFTPSFFLEDRDTWHFVASGFWDGPGKRSFYPHPTDPRAFPFLSDPKNL